MHDHDSVTEFDLLAWADGRLGGDPARKASIEAYLETRPELKARLEKDKQIHAAIRESVKDVVNEPAPDRLTARVFAPPSRPAWTAPAMAAVAAAAVLTLTFGIGWRFGSAVTPPVSEPSLAEPAYAELFPQTDSEAGLSPAALSTTPEQSAPDLSPLGIRPLSEESFYAKNRAVSRYLYSAPDGKTLIFMTSSPEPEPQAPLKMAETDSGKAVYWVRNGTAFGVAGDLPGEELMAVAQRIREDALFNQRPVPSPQLPEEQPIAAAAQPGAGIEIQPLQRNFQPE